ncbi:MAG: hypothetical protein IJZ30_06805 [Alphaproteobacteria bacterium]|nr:hypothetical protein [Alphaproteobacteria bacterium]
MLRKVLLNNIFMAFFFVILGGIVCGYTRFENSWDFANYHFYNAFSFLNNRYEKDIAVAYIHSFFNPLIEVPLYLYIKYFNDYPYIVSGLQGIWYGLLLFAFSKFSQIFFPLSEKKNVLPYLLTILISATGTAVYFQAGTSCNEHPIAILIFFSIYFLFKQIYDKNTQKAKIFLLIGIIMGMALGLKPTVVYLCISAGLSVILCYNKLKRPVLYIFLFALGGILGYLITNGWWMYKMYDLYQNPFFPFANKIFKSPYYAVSNFSDRRFIPEIDKMIIYPYLWMFTRIRPTETIFSDLRAPVYYTMGIVGTIWYIFKHHTINITQQEKNLWSFYIVFIVLSYILWMLIFSIHRYLVVIEMMCSIAFVKILFSLKYKKEITKILHLTISNIIIGIFILNVQTGQPWPFGHKEDKFIYIENIKIPSNTLIKLYNLPTAGVLPMIWQNNENDFLSISKLGYEYFGTEANLTAFGKFKELNDEIEKKHIGPEILIVRAYGDFMKLYKYGIDDDIMHVHEDLQMEFKDKYCRQLRTNIYKNLYICVPKELKDEILVDGGNDE